VKTPNWQTFATKTKHYNEAPVSQRLALIRMQDKHSASSTNFKRTTQ